MRYFFFSATFNISVNTGSQNFGIELDHYPSNEELRGVVRREIPGSRSVVIMAITEMKKEEYVHFWN